MINSASERPIASALVKPKVRSAAALNSITEPSAPIVTMASSTESRIAAFRRSLCASSIWARAPRLCFHQRPLHRGSQTLETILEQVVGRSDVQAFHRLLLDHSARHENHGHVWLYGLSAL